MAPPARAAGKRAARAGTDVGHIPADHPRAASLRERQLLADGFATGLVHPTGLTAHGRGEAFDYLLGERSPPEARRAARAAARVLVAATRPVLSVNGNVAALASRECVALVRAVNLRRARGAHPMAIEANVFHAGPRRTGAIIRALEAAGATGVLGRRRTGRIPGLSSHRALCAAEGILRADVVIVPLEDGDRAQALRRMGKVVVAVDLNPLSRTASAAHITLVDHVRRALPLVAAAAAGAPRALRGGPPTYAKSFDNRANLQDVQARMARRLKGGSP
jgi:4-phosphopantoate--beta-alanine ligase